MEGLKFMLPFQSMEENWKTINLPKQVRSHRLHPSVTHLRIYSDWWCQVLSTSPHQSHRIWWLEWIKMEGISGTKTTRAWNCKKFTDSLKVECHRHSLDSVKALFASFFCWLPAFRLTLLFFRSRFPSHISELLIQPLTVTTMDAKRWKIEAKLCRWRANVVDEEEKFHFFHCESY